MTAKKPSASGLSFTTHDCPKCGYRITDIEFKLARFDYLCPRCKKKKLSEFTLRKP